MEGLTTGAAASIPRDEQSVYATRASYFSHETSIKTIAWLNIIGGALFMAVVGLAVASELLKDESQVNAPGLVLVMVVLALSGIGLWISIALKQLKSWARITMAILYIPHLILIPIGTIVGGLFIWTLLHKKARVICSDDYRRIVSETPDIKQYRRLDNQTQAMNKPHDT